MLQGKAHIEDEEGRHYSLPSIDVWRECKLAPYALETCVRRLKCWQNIVAQQERNKHLIIVFFGRLPHEGEDTVLDERGVIRSDAHPWATQLAADFEEMFANVEDAATLETLWRPRSIPKLFSDAELREDFCRIDVTAMRARFFTRT